MGIIEHEKFGKSVELEEGGIRAVIAPEMGMSLVAFSVDGEQILDISREEIFLQTRKGLGPLILPHFNHAEKFPEIDHDKFPHIKPLFAMGVTDPFQHGVGRYACWNFEAGDNFAAGRISGSEIFNGYSMKEIAGFD